VVHLKKPLFKKVFSYSRGGKYRVNRTIAKNCYNTYMNNKPTAHAATAFIITLILGVGAIWLNLLEYFLVLFACLTAMHLNIMNDNQLLFGRKILAHLEDE
jgi:hypothetical protein